VFTKTKSLRVVLPLLLIASVLTVGTPSANAAPYDSGTKTGDVSCTGGGYFSVASGVVTGNTVCIGVPVIPVGVTSFSDSAFASSRITEINIPNSVTSIGRYGLNSIGTLNTVTFEANSRLTSIGYAAFAYSSNLTAINIPKSVTTIGPGAFYGTTLLNAVTFEAGSSLTSIDVDAFSSSGLTSIAIPAGVTSIGGNAFYGTTALTTYTYCGTASIIGTGLEPKTRNSVCATAPSPLFLSPSSYDGRFTVQIKDYDEAFTYTVTSSVGTASISSTGLITVTGLRPDQSVTVTVTITRTDYASVSGSITGRSQVAPMLPGTKPTVTISDSLITCTIGSYSATPTSSAFSLFVDGKHVSTIFSALGEYLPDWIIPWATSSTITRTATLTSASWTMTDAYKGKAITCATLAYSKNAIGFTASQVMVAR
jgi:hypothetical protein